MATGRPTKYTKELINKAHEYLVTYKTPVDEEKDDPEVIPSHIGLALYLGISTTCLYDWAKEEGKEEFSDILDKIMMTQQQVLINKGLTGDFNSNITKLVLGKHGFSDKQDTNVSGALGLTDLTEDELDRKLSELQSKLDQSTKD